MVRETLWLAALGPGALAWAGLFGGQTVAGATRTAARATLAALAVALGTAVAVAVAGAVHTRTHGLEGVGFGLYLDSLSAAMFILVSFIGVIVVRYARTYMDGDPGQARFTRMLCLTLACILTAIISGNLFQFWLAWIGTSTGLQALLVFYPERPAAILAARKKFIASRLGDACLLMAMVLLHGLFGSLDYTAMFASAALLGEAAATPTSLHQVALLLVIAGVLKSAQFPLHGWLIEVMETPTPVSALLHAGIINAGGFLVLRFAPLVAHSLPALDSLAILGGFTALFGSVVMLTQTSIKVSLAYSTIAQMGFMMLECGLGAFSAALLHIIAHSLYKAHAFLSSGSVIDIARASWTPSPGGKPHPLRMIMSIAAVMAVTLAVAGLLGATVTNQPGAIALGLVLVLGIILLVANGIDEHPNFFVLWRTAGYAVTAAAAYFGLQWCAEHVLAGALPPARTLHGPLEFGIVAAVVLSFAAVTFLQGVVPKQAGRPRWAALYAHVSNGFYVNTFANRLILRHWPAPAPTASAINKPLTAGVTG